MLCRKPVLATESDAKVKEDTVGREEAVCYSFLKISQHSSQMKRVLQHHKRARICRAREK